MPVTSARLSSEKRQIVERRFYIGSSKDASKGENPIRAVGNDGWRLACQDTMELWQVSVEYNKLQLSGEKEACRKIKKQQGDDLQTSDLWSVALYNDRATMILQLIADGGLDTADR